MRASERTNARAFGYIGIHCGRCIGFFAWFQLNGIIPVQWGRSCKLQILFCVVILSNIYLYMLEIFAVQITYRNHLNYL